MKAKVAERGQVTIPKPLRAKLGIGPGTVLEFDTREGALIAVKLETDDVVDQVYGSLGVGIDTDSMLRTLRGKA